MKTSLFFLAICCLFFTANGQDKGIMNYNGHWYLPGDNNLDKEALQYQQLIREKASFDTLAKAKDKFVTRDQFAQTMQLLDALVKDESYMPNNGETMPQLKALYDLVKQTKITVQGNDDYRRMVNTAIQRVVMARREGWSDMLYIYVMREATAGLLKGFAEKANTDNVIALVVNELQKDERYQSCKYNIAVDSRMMDDPDMQMFICDRMEYILGADIYRYRESTPGVVPNYTKRKKESADLMGWLLQRATQDKVKFITMVDYNHNAGSKPNEAITSLHRGTNWYIFLFYKGLLYYSDALPACSGNSSVSILYKP